MKAIVYKICFRVHKIIYKKNVIKFFYKNDYDYSDCYEQLLIFSGIWLNCKIYKKALSQWKIFQNEVLDFSFGQDTQYSMKKNKLFFSRK